MSCNCVRPTVRGGFRPGEGNGHRLLESRFERPIISVVDVAALTDTSFPVANTRVARLVDVGIGPR